MDNLNQGSDESVIHTTQKLIISGVGHLAAFTGSRLTLVESDSGNPAESIPFATILLAAAGTNKLREPVIRLTIRSPEGSTREIELVFIHLATGMDVLNRDKCIAILRDQGVPVRLEPYRAAFPSLSRKESMDAGTLEVDNLSDRPSVPEWTIYGITQNTKNPLPEEPPPVSPLLTIVALILIVGICIGGMTMMLPAPVENQSLSHHTVTKPTITTTPAPTTIATLQPVATIPPTMPPLPSQILIPPTGIWVRVDYPGNFTGQIAANGIVREVNSSGDQFYQMYMSSGTIDGFIEKGDGSVRNMSIQIYKDGTLVTSSNTSKPVGAAEIHTTV
jgi:hypothetical protein